MFLRYISDLIIHRKKQILLFLIGLIIIIIAIIFFIRFLYTPNIGLYTHYTKNEKSENVIVIINEPYAKAIQAGLKPGDIILSINGWPIKNIKDFYKSLYDIKDCNKIIVEILRNKEKKIIFKIEPILNILRIDWIFILLFSLISGYTAFYLIAHYYDKFEYLLFSFSALLYILLICVKPFLYENTISAILFHIGSFSVWLLVFFSLFFSSNRTSKITVFIIFITVIVLYIIYSCARIILLIQWHVSGITEWYRLFFESGKVYTIFEVIAYFLFACFIIKAYLKSISFNHKRQSVIILAGFIIAIIPYIVFEHLTIITENIYESSVRLGYYRYIFLSIFPVFFIIALLRKTSQKLKTYICQFIIYLTSLPLLLLIFFLFIDPLSDFFKNIYGFSLKMSIIYVNFLIFFILFLIYTIIFKVIKNKFEKNLINKLSDNKRSIVSEPSRHIDSFEVLSNIMTGLTKRIRKITQRINRDLIKMENRSKVLIKKINEQPENEGQNLYSPNMDIEMTMNQIEIDILHLNNLFKNISSLFILKPSLLTWVDTRYLIENAIKKICKKYQNIKVIKEVDSTCKIFCHPVEIIRSIKLLIENAVESIITHMEPIIILSYREENKIIIEIQDTGNGILQEHHNKIFEPFFTTKENHIGFGLYICKLLIEKNKGIIHIYSDISKGTKVQIIFAKS